MVEKTSDEAYGSIFGLYARIAQEQALFEEQFDMVTGRKDKLDVLGQDFMNYFHFTGFMGESVIGEEPPKKPVYKKMGN